MKKFSKKGVLLFAAAMALCAFAMPSMASAVSWGPLNSHHVLDSSDVGFTSTTALGTINSQCTASSFTTRVVAAANMEITGATFGGDCTFIVNGAAVCTATSTATGLPWTATPVSTSNIQIHGVNIDVVLSQSVPGTCPAALVGSSIVITGTLTGGTFDNPTHTASVLNAEGLSSHSPITGTGPVTAKGSFRDTSQTLTVS